MHSNATAKLLSSHVSPAVQVLSPLLVLLPLHPGKAAGMVQAGPCHSLGNPEGVPGSSF